MQTERAFLMVWDGLRPDRISAEATPNLWRLGQQGVWFERSHAVFPTVTRANSPAIATGCRPGRSGVPGNTFCLPSSTGSLERYSTGDAAHLQRLADADGRPIVLVDTLADRVHSAGGTTVVVGSGSPGSALLQHPRAAESGDPVIAEGIPWMAPFLSALEERFGKRPARRTPATAWDAWFTRVITEFVVPELTPTLLVFWHTEPDHSSHYRGHSAPETLRALRDADDNLGAILEAYDRLGLSGTTSVMVTSDHGSSTLGRRVAPASDLAGLLAHGVVAENGGATFVYSSEREVVAAIRKLDYAGPIFSRDGRDETFPLALVGLDGPRAPDVVFSLAWSDAAVDGVPGSAVGGASKLVVDHGTLSPHDLRNTLVAYGPDFRTAFRDAAPVGNIDVAPTLAHLLGLDQGTPFEGRVLTESLLESPAAPPTWHTQQHTTTYQARGTAWLQRIWQETVESTTYLAGGTIEQA